MMKQTKLLAIVLLTAFAALGYSQPPRKMVATGLQNARSIAVSGKGKAFVAVAGETGKDNSGAIVAIEDGKATQIATGMTDPSAVVAHQQSLYVVDKNRIWRVDIGKAKAEVLVAADAFPTPPVNLQQVAVDFENGSLYVSDHVAGDSAVIYRITQKKGKGGGGATVSVATDSKKCPVLKHPGALLLEGASYLLVEDSGKLHRIRLLDSSAETVADNAGGGLAWDRNGRLYFADAKAGQVSVIARPGEKPVVLATGFQGIGSLSFDLPHQSVLVLDSKAGTVTALPTVVPGSEIDETPLAIETQLAFPDVKWTGWENETEKGLPNPFRPVILTHAGDGSNRIFVGTQQGVIHVIPNDPKATQSEVFFDFHERVMFNPKEDEQGFLGMAFHPKHKTNGELFVFYTLKRPNLTNVVSRFRLKKDKDKKYIPNQVDPDSEEEILRITRPYWNHDGGTLCFGPDGYLYIALGDGGSGGDPKSNGQNPRSLLGRILRIDVDNVASGKAYAIPKDNPFYDAPGAWPETWAYGLRNVWRMAFDKKTGKLWAADVGQNLFEEIDIIVKGGNYGWKVREGLHPFEPKGPGQAKDLIDPIWEYHHEVGKSITGGGVYRGQRLPDLDGSYIYGDYVSGKIWALRYDEDKKRVVANRPIREPNSEDVTPIFSFGEDEQGEMYFLTSSRAGKSIYGFVRSDAK